MKAKLRLWMKTSLQLAAVMSLAAIAEGFSPTPAVAELASANRRQEASPQSTPDLFDLVADIQSRSEAGGTSGALERIESHLSTSRPQSVSDGSVQSLVSSQTSGSTVRTPYESDSPADLFDLIAAQPSDSSTTRVVEESSSPADLFDLIAASKRPTPSARKNLDVATTIVNEPSSQELVPAETSSELSTTRPLLADAEAIAVEESSQLARTPAPTESDAPNSTPDLFDLLADIEQQESGISASSEGVTNLASTSGESSEPARVPAPTELESTDSTPDLFDLLANIESREAGISASADAVAPARIEREEEFVASEPVLADAIAVQTEDRSIASEILTSKPSDTASNSEEPTQDSDITADVVSADTSSASEGLESSGDESDSPDLVSEYQVVDEPVDASVVSEPGNEPEGTAELPAIVSPSQTAEPQVALEGNEAPTPSETPVQEPVTPDDTAGTAQVPAVAQSVPDIRELAPTAPNEVRILTPTDNAELQQPAASVVLQFAVGAQVELRVNGKLVDVNQIGRTETDSSTDIVLQTWYGVSFKPGFNTLTARATAQGSQGPEISRTIKVAGGAESIHLETLEARIPADGRSTATVRGELRDENNLRSQNDGVITLFTSAGQFVGADFDPGQPGFQVEAINGLFETKLQSGNSSKLVSIQALSTGMEAFTRLEFSTFLRPSIATGVLDFRLGNRGTNFYDSFRNFLPADEDNGSQFDFYGAGFATGPVGEWLFTGAFNSDRTLNREGNGTTRLFRGAQSGEQVYPVYGDSSTTEHIATSKDSVYLRLERSPNVLGAPTDFLMWGDFRTEEFSLQSQEFSAVSRILHGFKTNFTFGNVQLTGLFSDDTDGFQRDSIAPDGTSGFYFLSRRELVPGTEEIVIEMEELLRPGTVVQRERLTRGIDYDIDYDRGSLLFRQPLLRTAVARDITGVDDGETLVRRIVASYQFESEGNTSIYGGRAVYHLSREVGSESWLGATYFKENQGTRQFELYGLDTRIPVGPNSDIIAEYAHSTNDSDTVGEVSGHAYRLEFNGEFSDKVTGRAYWRTADEGFSNDATTSFVAGQTRYGAEVRATFSANTSFRFQFDREDNFGTAPQVLTELGDLLDPRLVPVPGQKVDNSLTTLSLGVQQQMGDADLQLDYVYRDREDRQGANPLSSTSSQLRTRLNAPINDRLTFRAQNDLTLSSSEDIAYPDRTQIGLDWQIAEDLTLGIAQNWIGGSGQFGGQNYTSVEIAGNRQYDSNSSLSGRYGIVSGINGVQGQGSMGLNHRWELSPGLFADVTYERAIGGLFGVTGAGSQFSTPFISNQGGSALGVSGGESYSIGLEYTDNPDLKMSARFEERTNSSGSNQVISANVEGKVTPALTALLRYQQANSASQNLDRLGDTVDLRLGLAYRNPDNDKFNALLRYEYRKNPSIIPETLFLGRGTGSEEHLFAFEAIYAPNWRWELYGKYAFRDSTSFLANSFVNSSSVSLGQLRATYRINYHWDVLAEARWINQPSAGYSETGFVTEVGYYLNPNLRFALGYSAGNIDDPDFSGSRSANGVHVGMTVKVNELFNGFGLQKVAPTQQAEAALAATEAGSPETVATETDGEEPSVSESEPADNTRAETDDSLVSQTASQVDPAGFVPRIDMSAVLDRANATETTEITVGEEEVK